MLFTNASMFSAAYFFFLNLLVNSFEDVLFMTSDETKDASGSDYFPLSYDLFLS